MRYLVGKLTDQEHAALLHDLPEPADWKRLNAGVPKACAQADFPCTDRSVTALRTILGRPAIERALPHRWTDFRLMRYSPGDYFGPHVDQAFSEYNGLRSDLTLCVLLRAALRGGVLRLDDGTELVGEGSIFLYPTSQVHEVTQVIDGERIVLVAWMQSRVREAERRELLARLNDMETRATEPTPERIRSVRLELLRRWGGV